MYNLPALSKADHIRIEQQRRQWEALVAKTELRREVLQTIEEVVRERYPTDKRQQARAAFRYINEQELRSASILCSMVRIEAAKEQERKEEDHERTLQEMRNSVRTKPLVEGGGEREYETEVEGDQEEQIWSPTPVSRPGGPPRVANVFGDKYMPANIRDASAIDKTFASNRKAAVAQHRTDTSIAASSRGDETQLRAASANRAGTPGPSSNSAAQAQAKAPPRRRIIKIHARSRTVETQSEQPSFDDSSESLSLHGMERRLAHPNAGKEVEGSLLAVRMKAMRPLPLPPPPPPPSSPSGDDAVKLTTDAGQRPLSQSSTESLTHREKRARKSTKRKMEVGSESKEVKKLSAENGQSKGKPEGGGAEDGKEGKRQK